MNLNNLKSKKYSAGEYIERGSACIMETDGTVYLFDITDSSHTLKYIGVAFNTCSQGQIIEIIQQGFLGWNGAPYQKGVVYYIGSDSKLTSTPPISGIIKAVAIGLPSTVINGQPVQAVAITEEYDLTGSGGAVWGNITGVITDQTDLITYLGANYVPQARNITINGTTYDLSANRSWTVGDLLSSGSYTNPSWLVSIPWSKITSTPTTLSGYGITDAIDGSGTANQIPYFVDSNTLGSLSTSTYPSLTELSHVKGVTSAIQTQINNIPIGIQWTNQDKKFSYDQARNGLHINGDFVFVATGGGILGGNADSFNFGYSLTAGTVAATNSGTYNTITLSTGAVNNSLLQIFYGYSTTFKPFSFIGSDTAYINFRVRVNNLNDGTDRFLLQIGNIDTGATNIANGYYFTYDLSGTQSGSATSANWQVVTANGSNRTWTTSGVAVSASSWVTLSMEITTSSVTFYINGAQVGSPHTTNITTVNTGMVVRLLKTNGTNSRSIDVDYITFDQSYNTPR